MRARRAAPAQSGVGGGLARRRARRFTLFIFASMLAYSAQELLVEPFAGLVFGLPPGATTKLAGLQHGGVLVGMLLVAALAGRGLGSLKGWTVVGCMASAASLVGLAASGKFGADPLALRICVAALGAANGIYAVAAIGSMMALAGAGARGREGARMGVWAPRRRWRSRSAGSPGRGSPISSGLREPRRSTPMRLFS